jgi:HSP20 family molecular chaperone IbpA
MKCPRCSSNVEKGWEYCPRCGSDLGRRDAFSLNNTSAFDDVFRRVHQQMEEMDKTFKKDFEVFDLSPMLRDRPHGGKAKGFRITIKSGTGMKPDVSVKTFGDVNENEVKRGMEQLGMDRTAQGGERRFRLPGLGRPRAEKSVPDKKGIQLPEATEEPKTTVRRTDSRVVVEIEMPGVRSEEDIEVRELENSVEIKAVAKGKGYFKILTKPSQFRLSSKRFEKGKLMLELS